MDLSITLPNSKREDLLGTLIKSNKEEEALGFFELSWTHPSERSPTKGPMWGHPVPVLGAISPFLEPFRGCLSPNIDNVSEKNDFEIPHKGPWVDPDEHL